MDKENLTPDIISISEVSINEINRGLAEKKVSQKVREEIVDVLQSEDFESIEQDQFYPTLIIFLRLRGIKEEDIKCLESEEIKQFINLIKNLNRLKNSQEPDNLINLSNYREGDELLAA